MLIVNIDDPSDRRSAADLAFYSPVPLKLSVFTGLGLLVSASLPGTGSC